jgi:hypothetical protein
MQAQSEQYFKQRGTEIRSSPKQLITLPSGVTGVDVTNDILSGGRSRRTYMLGEGVVYAIDCETSVSNWENLEPTFARIVNSFTLQRKP